MAEDGATKALPDKEKVSIDPSAATHGSSAGSDAAVISELSDEVTNAVRSAVTRVMAQQNVEPKVKLPDFSLEELSGKKGDAGHAPPYDNGAQSSATVAHAGGRNKYRVAFLSGLFFFASLGLIGIWTFNPTKRVDDAAVDQMTGSLKAPGAVEDIAAPGDEAKRQSTIDVKREAPALSKPDSEEPARNTDKKQSVPQILALADVHMRAGRILEARRLLRPAAEEASAEAAFALAKSYDENYLSAVENADASGDAGKAEHWYRIWHKRAVEQGLVSKTVNVDRLIRSLLEASRP